MKFHVGIDVAEIFSAQIIENELAENSLKVRDIWDLMG